MYTEASTFRSLICALLWYSVDLGQKENNFLNLKEFKIYSHLFQWFASQAFFQFVEY